MRTPLICISALAVALSGCGSSGSDSPDVTGSPVTPDDGSPVTQNDGSPAEPDEDSTPDEGEGGPVTGGTGLITSDSYEEILRQVVIVANDEVLDAASKSVGPLFATVANLADRSNTEGAASGNGLSFVSRELAADAGTLPFDFVFSCDGGGTLVANALYDESYYGGLPQVQELTFRDTCVVDGDSYDGVAYRAFRPNRGADIERYDGFSVTHADGSSFTLDGDYVDTTPAGYAPAIDFGWTDTDYTADEGGSTTRIDGYTSLHGAVYGFLPSGNRTPSLYTAELPNGETATVGEIPHDATVKVTFAVTAPWSSDERLDVEVDLSITDSFYEFVPVSGGTWLETLDYPLSDLGSPLVLTTLDTGEQLTIDNLPRPEATQWQTGTLTITAADGSALALSPETGDPATFSVTLDGEPGPLTREWSDGFQVSCPRPINCR